jgi:signal transduction histidine kinase/ActR/RegA family two-component response regulator
MSANASGGEVVPELGPPLVLLLDEIEERRVSCALQLTAAGLDVVSAATAADGFELIGVERELGVIVLSIAAPELAGLDHVLALKQQHPLARSTPVLVIADSVAGEAKARALISGADEVLARSLVREELPRCTQLWVQLGAARRKLELRELHATTTLADADAKLVEAQRQLGRAQKLESMGRLANGVAHDFNNMLTAIICFTRFVVDDMASEDPRRTDLVEVLKAADNAARMINQLLTFSRRKPVQPVNLDVNAAVTSVGRVLRRTLGAGIELVILPAEEPLFVLVDPGQFDQMMFNFALNARDAMTEAGTITFRLARTQVAPEQELAAGDYVELIVSDNGPSMTTELAARAFEPTFSANAQRGTGLGLATCQAIVEQAHGSIALESQPGGGSCFRVLLPRASDVRRSEPARSGRAQLPVVLHGTALVVEDQPAILRTMTRALSTTGLHVLEAVSGEGALALLEAGDSVPELLVTDIVLPRMSGQQLAARLRQRAPQLKVLFVSGYVGDEHAVPIELDAKTAFIAKPFTGQQLVTRAAALLAAAEEPALDNGVSVPR